MNRRDLLKKLAAAPVAAVVAPLAIANDGVALNSMAHPTMEGDFDTANLHYAKYELSADTFATMEIELPAHEWDARCVCLHCKATQTEVENGDVPLACWTRHANRRHKALVASTNQTWNEALSKADIWS